MNQALITTFTHNLDRLGVTWELEDNPVAARLSLLRRLQESNRQEILAWDPQHLPISGLEDALNDVGIRFTPVHRRYLRPELMIGLTSAHAALADTGSLVLDLGPGQSWLPALIVLHHMVLLPTSRLYPHLTAWRQAHTASPPSPTQLIITGPSVSDDIELHPHRGMFGPGHQHIILFHDTPSP